MRMLIAIAVGATIISGMVTVYRGVPQQLGREFRAYGANLQIILANAAATFDFEKISEVHAGLAEHEIIGAELAKIFLPYEPSEIIGQEVTISAGEGTAMKKYVVSGIVSTGGKEEDFAFMNLADFQQIVDKPAQVSVVQFSVVAEGGSLP